MESRAPTGLNRRKTTRQARSAVTVDAIFDGAVQVLLSDGPTRLTTTRVAQRAGVSVGTLYQYFPNKRALLYAALERHLAMLVESLEAACLGSRGVTVEMMAEAVVTGYLRAKIKQCEVSRALYLIAIELDAYELVEAASRRGEQAIASMLSTASDGGFPDPSLIAQILLAAIYGTARAFFERASPPALGGEVERQLTIMCRSYLAAVSSTAQRAA